MNKMRKTELSRVWDLLINTLKLKMEHWERTQKVTIGVPESWEGVPFSDELLSKHSGDSKEKVMGV